MQLKQNRTAIVYTGPIHMGSHVVQSLFGLRTGLVNDFHRNH